MISKVQHRNFEKGEFVDESNRDLAETLELVRTFPWDNERTLTVIQLTGPSVTIKDEHANYLKIGLYFNGKFCLYYLDNHNHLYEYHTGDLQVVNQLIIHFFYKELDLSNFEKHFINIGNKAHFETAIFEYHASLWRILPLIILMVSYGAFVVASIGLIVVKQGPAFFALPVSIAFFYFIFKTNYQAFVNRHNYLKISRGNDVFLFGQTEDTVKIYNKADVTEIKIDGKAGSKSTNSGVFIYFKNGETIHLTSILMSNIDLRLKFMDAMDNPTVLFTLGSKGIFQKW